MYSRQERRKSRALSLGLLGIISLVIVSFGLMLTTRKAQAATSATAPHVDVMVLNTDIGPASLQFLTQTITAAEQDGAQALVIEVDSPGGDITSMKAMTEAELNSTVPIITYVYPTGAYAASAASFVTLAAPIAAMAPTTRIGASSPINSDGSNLDSTLQSKIEHDLTASMTAMQERFHRQVAPATAMVTNAASYNDAAALSDGIVNLQATNLTDLLNKVNGETVTLSNGQTVTLHTSGDSVQTLNPTIFDTIYGFLLDPNVVFLLFVIAMIGIFLEIAHPGAILPGTVGGIALILFLLTIGSLAPNWAGLALMVLAFVLLVLDLRLPTHGILTVGAVISLIFGALILFNNTAGPYSEPQIDPVVVYVMAGFVGVLSFALISVIVRVRRHATKTGKEGMIGAKAIATTPLLPEGRVSYGGEDWAAVLDGPAVTLDAGTEVRVVAVQGLRLHVQPWYSQVLPGTIETHSSAPLKE
jgi:membrane-bound serine protease (ClpP class)